MKKITFLLMYTIVVMQIAKTYRALQNNDSAFKYAYEALGMAPANRSKAIYQRLLSNSL